MLKSGSFFNHLAVKVLFCVVGLFGLAGCSQTPKIYKMPPEHVEKIRSDLGTIGVTVSSYPLKRKTKMPAKGVIGGAERGFAMGAARFVYAKTTINIRSGPGTNHSVIRKATKGEALEYVSLEGDWYKLKVAEGKPQEWVYRNVVTVSE
jgi:uncharacterized protein YgiM (DUF1202 family)